MRKGCRNICFPIFSDIFQFGHILIRANIRKSNVKIHLFSVNHWKNFNKTQKLSPTAVIFFSHHYAVSALTVSSDVIKSLFSSYRPVYSHSLLNDSIQ